jgi:hypothetical protein
VHYCIGKHSDGAGRLKLFMHQFNCWGMDTSATVHGFTLFPLKGDQSYFEYLHSNTCFFTFLNSLRKVLTSPVALEPNNDNFNVSLLKDYGFFGLEKRLSAVQSFPFSCLRYDFRSRSGHVK